MTPQNDICPICSYGSSAQYCEWPSDEQRRTGVVPLDSLPAAWWNNMWADATGRINEARDMVGQLITELNSVLAQAGICPQSACTDQLYQSINKIRQTLSTDTVPGAVVSSSAANKVAVAVDGTMTVNCFGNAAALTTTASTVVGAINELKSTYDCCIDDLNTAVTGLGTNKAPNMHASDQTTYGVGNATCYGHVKLSDTYSSVLQECSGVAASQYALATAYACLIACAGAPLGNTAGCALGTAAAGSCSTAARSDHVHPVPECVACSDKGKNGSSYSAFGSNAFNSTAFTTCTGTVTISNKAAANSDTPVALCTGATTVGKSGSCGLNFNTCTGALTAKSFCGLAACASKDGSGCALGTAARCASTAFRASTWTPSLVNCANQIGIIANAWCPTCTTPSGILVICNRCNFPIMAFGSTCCREYDACRTRTPVYVPALGKVSVSGIPSWSNTAHAGAVSCDGIRLF